MSRRRSGRTYCNEPRFNEYRTITARFDSVGSCGHQIRQGDIIGYAKKRTRCPACWAAWQQENHEADQYEYNQGFDCYPQY